MAKTKSIEGQSVDIGSGSLALRVLSLFSTLVGVIIAMMAGSFDSTSWLVVGIAVGAIGPVLIRFAAKS
jgi:hypothetical protein